jgi:hypothetical protein
MFVKNFYPQKVASCLHSIPLYYHETGRTVEGERVDSPGWEFRRKFVVFRSKDSCKELEDGTCGM